MVAQAVERHIAEPGFAAMPEGWGRLVGLALLVGALALVFLLYRRESRSGAGRGVRRTLACLRCAALLALVLVWLAPVMSTYTIRTVASEVIVLVDASESMDIRDAGSAAPRATLAQELLGQNDSAWLRRLAAKNAVRAYAFADGLKPLALPWDSADDSAPPVSQPSDALRRFQTDLGSALGRAAERAADHPIAGIVVITDGAVNQGMRGEEIAVYASQLRAPVYPIGVGAPQEPPNARIAAFSAPGTVAQGDPIAVRLELAGAGLESGATRLTVTTASDDAGAPPVIVSEIPIALGAAPVVQELKIPADQPGEIVLRASLEPLADEAVLVDNAREIVVRVLDDRLRVLMISGGPSYAYRFIHRLLERDRTIDVSCWLQSADAQAIRDGDIPIQSLPRTPEEMFAYDAILLLDPDPRELDSTWCGLARRLVDEFGAGLLLQAGPHFTSRFLSDHRLVDLVATLPVQPDPDAEVRLSAQGAFRAAPQPLVTPEDARAHPLLALLDDEAANRDLWRRLPAVWWRLPVLREKPLASVLLRCAGPGSEGPYGPSVLLATQPFGAGRTAFLGFSNWRWRATAEPQFDRFWVQMVRYLAQARRQGASKRGVITLDRETLRVGDYVRIEARVLDASFLPWHEPSVEATLETRDGRRSLPLKAIPEREGWFGARLTVDWLGDATLRIPLPGEAEDGEQLVKRLRVETPQLEFASVRQQVELLNTLAERTGGRYAPIEQGAQTADWIENASETKRIDGRQTPLWDNGWTLLLVTTLLGVEWAIRRRSHLL